MAEENSQVTIKDYATVREELTSKLKNGELVVLEGVMDGGRASLNSWITDEESTWDESSYFLNCDDKRVYELHVKKRFSKIECLDRLRAYVNKEGFDENKIDQHPEFLEKIIDGKIVAVISGDQEYKL